MTNFLHVDGFENSRFWHSSLDRRLLCRSGNNSCKKFCGIFSRFVPSAKFFLTVDGYNMNGDQVSLAVMLWLSGVAVNLVFISGGLDVRAETYLLIIAA